MEEYFQSLRKYNFWEGNVPEVGFLRKDYTEKIIDYTKKSLQYTLAISCPIMFGIMGIATNLIPWFLGDEFIPSINTERGALLEGDSDTVSLPPIPPESPELEELLIKPPLPPEPPEKLLAAVSPEDLFSSA